MFQLQSEDDDDDSEYDDSEYDENEVGPDAESKFIRKEMRHVFPEYSFAKEMHLFADVDAKWTGREEYLLLEAARKCCFHWFRVADCLSYWSGQKFTPEETKEHYESIYYYGDFGIDKWPLLEEEMAISDLVQRNAPNANDILPDFKCFPDFPKEWQNKLEHCCLSLDPGEIDPEAEILIGEVEFNDYDDDDDTEMKINLLKIYKRRMKTRENRLNLIKSQKIIEASKEVLEAMLHSPRVQDPKHTQFRLEVSEFLNMLPLTSFLPEKEFKKYYTNRIKEQVLKEKIEKILDEPEVCEENAKTMHDDELSNNSSSDSNNFDDIENQSMSQKSDGSSRGASGSKSGILAETLEFEEMLQDKVDAVDISAELDELNFKMIDKTDNSQMPDQSDTLEVREFLNTLPLTSLIPEKEFKIHYTNYVKEQHLKEGIEKILDGSGVCNEKVKTMHDDEGNNNSSSDCNNFDTIANHSMSQKSDGSSQGAKRSKSGALKETGEFEKCQDKMDTVNISTEPNEHDLKMFDKTVASELPDQSDASQVPENSTLAEKEQTEEEDQSDDPSEVKLPYPKESDGLNILTEHERMICEKFDLPPVCYFAYKLVLISADKNAQQGNSLESYNLHPADLSIEQVRLIIDFMSENGWINPKNFEDYI